MQTSHLHGATHALLFNEEGKVLLNQRQNTGYYDGGWTLISGHIEPEETAYESMKREIAEETGLQVTLSDIEAHHVINRLTKEGRAYFDVSFVINHWEGTPSITEPEKCIALERFALDDLPEHIPPESFLFIEEYLANNKGFSELDLRTN